MAISARCSTTRRIDAWNGAVSPPRRVSLRHSWRIAPPLRWFGLYSSMSLTEPSAQVADSSSAPRPASRTTVRSVILQPRRSIARTAPSSGTSRAGVPTRRITSAPTNQPTARPSSERAGTTALTARWIGTNASSSAHHQRRHRAGSHGPDTVSMAASIAIQRGSSRNCERKVFGCSATSKCHRGAAIPSGRTDNASTEMTPAAAYAPSSFQCLPAISPMRIANGSATIAMP